jgi:predicted secreted protein
MAERERKHMRHFHKYRTSRLLQTLAVALMLPILPASAQVAGHVLPKARVSDGQTVTLTDADNGHAVTLHSGDSLIVRLAAHVDGGFTWHIVWAASRDLLVLQSDHYDPPGMVGGTGTRIFRFSVRPMAQSGTQLAEWLRFLELRPFEKGVTTPNLFQVHVTVSPRVSKTPTKKP